MQDHQPSANASSNDQEQANFPLINELKIRARLLLNALQAQDSAALQQCQQICLREDWPVPDSWRLRHALNIVAHQAGFRHYEHARQVVQLLPNMQSVPESEFVQRVLTSFMVEGRIVKIPQMRKKRLVILTWLVTQLAPEQRYSETEINQFIQQFHEDFATLRREFIACKLMARENEVYWRI